MATPTTSGPTSSVPLSWNNFIDALTANTKWGGAVGTGVTLTASFPGYSSYWANNYGYYSVSEPFTGFAPLSVLQQSAAKNAMAVWANVANIQWQMVSETSSLVGDVRIAFSSAVATNSNGEAWGYAYYPNSSYPDGGDIWIDSSIKSSSFSAGTYDYMALVHELGHALGLKHPFEAPNTLSSQYDTWQYSIMSYTEPTSLGWGKVLPSTPMLLDIQAMQYLYGANMSYHSGDDVYKFDPAHLIVETIWDAGGTNTFDASAFNTAVKIDLIDGDYSSIGLQSNVAIAYNAKIQNAIGGSGGNTIYGNELANQITGGSGTDYLSGLAGNDTIAPGQGKSWVNGGVGTNTAVFGASLASYQFVRDGDSLRVKGPGNIRAILTDVQTLSFSDGTVAVSELASHAQVSTSSVRAGIVELYVAMVGRAPELDGFQFWEGVALDGAKSTLDLANMMFTLPIVQAVYPESADQTSFINSIYQFVLGRTPDSDGLAFWQNQLSSGSVTRGGLMVDLVNVALNTLDGTPGKAFLVNRIAAAQAAVELQEASAISLSVDVLTQAFSGITNDPATVSVELTSLKGQVADDYDNLASAATVTTTGVLIDGHAIQWVS